MTLTELLSTKLNRVADIGGDYDTRSARASYFALTMPFEGIHHLPVFFPRVGKRGAVGLMTIRAIF